MLNKKLFNNKTVLSSYSGKVWRTVETQETAATLGLVDSMEEQGVLEELLDNIKPPYRPGTEKMHYLLKTAFRYPPLKYGSRFGTRLQPSFFYASENILTSLAETAFYRFIFLADLSVPYPKPIDSKHSVFSVNLKTTACLDLCSSTFFKIHSEINNPISYKLTQDIGAWAMKQEIGLIRFESARLPENNNLAVAEPKVIRSKVPVNKQSWLCRTSSERISFSSREAKMPILFQKQMFLVNGVLPRPA